MNDLDHTEDLDLLLNIYDSVDQFVTVMNSISPMVEQAVNLYYEIEELTLSKIDLEERLKNGECVKTQYIDTSNEITLHIEELSELLEGVRSFAKLI